MSTYGIAPNWMDKLPVWVKAVFIIGPTALIALMLTWRIPIQIGSLIEKVDAQGLTTVVAVTEFNAFRDEHQGATETLVRLMRQVCVNGAKTQEAIHRCLE